MNIWTIVVIALALIALTGIVIASIGVDGEEESNACSLGCGNSCTATNNCGQASCGGVSGRSCGCK